MMHYTNFKSNQMADLAIANRIIELAGIDDFEGILNLGLAIGTEKISRNSAVSVKKRAYLKLSLRIHPDRLLSNPAEATKSFQALIKAYEFLSSPDIPLDAPANGKKAKEKVPSIARSNEGFPNIAFALLGDILFFFLRLFSHARVLSSM
jgi:hypothetical protein